MRERKTREWEERCETRTARTRRASGRSGVRRGRRARRRGEAARARATCTHPLDAETARVRCHPLASEAGRARADEREAAWAQRRPSLELRGAHARVAAEARPPREGETRRRARPVALFKTQVSQHRHPRHQHGKQPTGAQYCDVRCGRFRIARSHHPSAVPSKQPFTGVGIQLDLGVSSTLMHTQGKMRSRVNAFA